MEKSHSTVLCWEAAHGFSLDAIIAQTKASVIMDKTSTRLLSASQRNHSVDNPRLLLSGSKC